MKGVILMITYSVLIFIWGAVVGWVFRGLRGSDD